GRGGGVDPGARGDHRRDRHRRARRLKLALGGKATSHSLAWSRRRRGGAKRHALGVDSGAMSTAIEVRANGIRFHVLEEGEGDRLALCLHGFPELSISWRHQLPLLARLGYRAWAPDLRGYGRTERPPRTRDYAIETLIEDVVGLIEAGGRPATLIAHDWGGIIAWYVAMRRPELLERLVIMNVPHPAPLARELRTNLRQLSRLSYTAFFQIPRLPERVIAQDDYRRIDNAFTATAVDPSCFGEEDLRAYREAASQPGALKAMLSYYRAYLRGGGLRRQRKLG